MSYKILEAEKNGLKFEIEEDYPEVGAYLYVFSGDKCIADYLQNTIDICKKFAFKKYGVPLDKWVEKNRED